MLSYLVKSLARNPRRALAAVIGIALAFALFADTAFFLDGSGRQMTRRAIAHVALDMQAGVNEPLASSLSLATSVSPRPPIAANQPVTVTLVAKNTGPATATDVVLDAPRRGSLAYQLGSIQRDGAPVGDVVPPEEGSTPSSPLDTGLRLGNLAPGASTTVSYMGTTIGAVASAADLVASSVHSAGDQAPALANGHEAVDLEALASTVRRLPGIGAAQPFALVNAPTRSAQVGERVLDAPIALVGMDPAYEQSIPLVRFGGGRFAPGTAFLSPAAMQALGASPGMTLRLRLPGQFGPDLTVPISAVADLTAGDQLFASRKEGSLGDYVAAPYVVGLDVPTFQRQVLPALRADAAAPVPVLKRPPVLEVHAQAAKSLLDGDPGAAFRATSGLRRSIEQAGPGELSVIDNLSASLERARTDSTLAKILFIALGLPGTLLAGYLSFYGGGLLAEAERRERALLRPRGFAPAALARSLAYQAAAMAALGSAIGAAVALAVARALFPSQFDPHGAGFVISLSMAVGVSLLTTMLAIYLPGRRSILGDVTEARQAIARTPRPAWLRAKLDVILLVVAGAVFAIFIGTGGLSPNAKASQESIARSFYVLLAPWCLWLGATLLATRGLLAVTRRVSTKTSALDFRRHLVTRTLLRSVARRPAMVTASIVTVSLTVAFGMSLAIFVDTFRVQQRADARFIVGADVRVTPSLGEPIPGLEHRIRGAGGRASSPVARVPDVVVGNESVLYAAIDPASFGMVAPLDQGFFTDITPHDAMRALAQDPSAVLVDKETADRFTLHKGDTVKLQVPSVALGQPALLTAHVAGTLIQFPGFPLGLDFVGTLDAYQQATGASTPSYFLVSTDGSGSSTSRVADSLRGDLGTSAPTRIETTAVVGNQDQSSLAGLSLTGLGRVEGLYMLLVAVLATVLFVAAVLMQRDTERATMRALGLARPRLHALIFGEVVVVATTSVCIGTVIGIPMAYLFEQILRRVFVVPPTRLALPSSAFFLVVVLLFVILAVAAAIISAAIRKLRLVELLRAE
ncbi:MAG: DUF11 domain-containing protein [Actinomycetota bacterium]|nr:DUF11 domain-containing protein [Actinomycetota bacterium]